MTRAATQDVLRIMARPQTSADDLATDAAALLRRIGFFGLLIVTPIVAQVSRRATVVLSPIAVILLILASAIDGRQRPLRAGLGRMVRSPAFLASVLIIVWTALSLTWTPFLQPATERLANLVTTILLTLAGYLALPDRMRSANLYLLPLGVGVAAIVAILIGLFGDAMIGTSPDGESALERGATLLALLCWPSVAWLRSRGRNIESLVVAVLVAAALLRAPTTTPLFALAVGALYFALTLYQPSLGARITAISLAGVLAIAPLIPFVAKPIGKAAFGSASATVQSIEAWRGLITSEPVRLITGHGFETALRGRFVGLVPTNAPTTVLFELWFELGVVGAFAAAFALFVSIRRCAAASPTLVPGAMAAFVTAFTIGGIGVGLTVMWWLTSLAIAALVFVAIERGQFRSRRPKVSLLTQRQGEAPS